MPDGTVALGNVGHRRPTEHGCSGGSAPTYGGDSGEVKAH